MRELFLFLDSCQSVFSRCQPFLSVCDFSVAASPYLLRPTPHHHQTHTRIIIIIVSTQGQSIRMLVAAARACHLRVCWNSDRVCWRNYLRHSIRWHPLHCLHTALLLLPPRKPTQNKENGFRHSLVCVCPFLLPFAV